MLGYPSVKRMLSEMTSAELTEWRAYAAIEPFGEDRMDIRFGQLCALVANCFTAFAGGKESYEIDNFLLKFGTQYQEEEEPNEAAVVDDVAAQIAAMRAVFMGMGAIVKDKEGNILNPTDSPQLVDPHGKQLTGFTQERPARG